MLTTETAESRRITTIDFVRGIAILGILTMNIIAFSMPVQAYLNPTAYGIETTADLVSWAFSFIFIEGKMRGLFSFLFGASILLIIERAIAKGEPAASIHFRRMAWLAVFGLLHFYLIWWGDILFLYAVIGMIAWNFRNLERQTLIKWSAAFILLEFLVWSLVTVNAYWLSVAAAAPAADAGVIEAWTQLQKDFAIPTAEQLRQNLETFRGNYSEILRHRITDEGSIPLLNLILYGPETLAYILLGMWALKSGFISGQWSRDVYRRIGLWGFLTSAPLYALLVFWMISSGFSMPVVFAATTATVILRPIMVMAVAAVIILSASADGWLGSRITAAGRAAFTNYLGTSIVMTAIFYGYGLGLYGHLSRIELWPIVLLMWAGMLVWSKPWLKHFRYGPFEWLWRTLARWSPQPMRIQAANR